MANPQVIGIGLTVRDTKPQVNTPRSMLAAYDSLRICSGVSFIWLSLPLDFRNWHIMGWVRKRFYRQQAVLAKGRR